jgi:hypothetical protein
VHNAHFLNATRQSRGGGASTHRVGRVDEDGGCWRGRADLVVLPVKILPQEWDLVLDAMPPVEPEVADELQKHKMHEQLARGREGVLWHADDRSHEVSRDESVEQRAGSEEHADARHNLLAVTGNSCPISLCEFGTASLGSLDQTMGSPFRLEDGFQDQHRQPIPEIRTDDRQHAPGEPRHRQPVCEPCHQSITRSKKSARGGRAPPKPCPSPPLAPAEPPPQPFASPFAGRDKGSSSSTHSTGNRRSLPCPDKRWRTPSRRRAVGRSRRRSL